VPLTLYKLIYFKGCPNTKVAEQRLGELGIRFERICQDLIPEDSPYKFYSSPTLLKGDAVIFGAITGSDGGCSVDLPSIEELRKRLL